MTASLHVVGGPDRGRLFTIGTSSLTIGRNADNTIVLNDVAVSGVHSRIVRNARGGYTILDADSTNGTFVNGTEQRAIDLKDGDQIRIGESTFVFHSLRRSGIMAGGQAHVGTVQVESDAAGSVPSFALADASRLDRQALEAAFRRITLLEQLDQVLVEMDGSSEILSAVLDAALTAADAQRGFILLVDDASGEILPSLVRDLTGGSLQIPFSKSMAFDVVATGRGQVALEAIDDAQPRPVLCAPIATSGRTAGVIHLDLPRSGQFAPEALEFVQAIGRRAGASVVAAKSRVDFDLLFSSMIDAIMKSIQAKDVYTRGHSERVRHYAKLLGKELGLSGNELYRVSLGAGLHDIGKIGMPDDVLKHNTTPQLTPEQLAEVKKHPGRGGQILKDIPFLKDIVPAAELHHEDWDGGGYPHGLKGEEIPLIARIVAVADTYDAITTDRPYQKGKSYEEGHQILRKIAGKRLEPELVEAFISAFNKYRKVPGRPMPAPAVTPPPPQRQPVAAGAAPPVGGSEQTVMIKGASDRLPAARPAAIGGGGSAAAPAANNGGAAPAQPAPAKGPDKPAGEEGRSDLDQGLQNVILIG